MSWDMETMLEFREAMVGDKNNSIKQECLVNVPKMLQDSRYMVSVATKDGRGTFPLSSLLQKESKKLLYDFIDILIKNEINNGL